MNAIKHPMLSRAVSYATNFRLWARGGIASAITGASTSGLSALGLTAAKAAGVEVETMTLKQLAAVLISGGLVGALAYLQRSPLPPLPEPPPEIEAEKPESPLDEDRN